MVAHDMAEMSSLERFDGGMVELSLLLPSWQIEALERVACAEGLTVGQLLRRLVNRTISQHAADAGEKPRQA